MAEFALQHYRITIILIAAQAINTTATAIFLPYLNPKTTYFIDNFVSIYLTHGIGYDNGYQGGEDAIASSLLKIITNSFIFI